MVELESPVHVHCDKETPVHVYVRKNGNRGARSAAKRNSSNTRARSPNKNSKSPTRRPWCPAPGKTSLDDEHRPDKDICIQERPKNKRTKSRGNFQSREELLKSVSAYESNIASLMNEIDGLKSELEFKNKTETDSLVDQITQKSKEAKSQENEIEIPTKNINPKEDEEYTEIGSNFPENPETLKEALKATLDQPKVTEVYRPEVYSGEKVDLLQTMTDADRDRLQHLLMKAELDLENLNFNDPIAVDQFMATSRDIRAQLALLKRANFDVSRLEQQRDAVIQRLAKTDSECALVRQALIGRETDLRDTKIDNELNQEKIIRLQSQLDSAEQLKSRLQRELFTREGELNRSQCRERVAAKEISQLKADLNYEKSNNGKTKLDLEKQALKKACKHHKTKAEALSIHLDEAKLDLKRTRSELEAWKERSKRNIDQVEDQVQALHESQRGVKYAEEKIEAKARELKETKSLVEGQAQEIGQLRVQLAETKTMAKNRRNELDNAREDALASLQTLRDLPEELQQAHRRLDEAVKEIRRLEERNADLEVQVHRSNTHLNISQSAETELKIYSQKLNSAEIRLEEMQRSLNEANEENDEIRQDATNWRLRADERQHTIAALERQIEAMAAEHRRALESENEKFTIKERSNNNRLSEMELDITRLNGELGAVKRQKEDAERRHSSAVNDIRDRLDHSEATNRSMQSYVNFLKSSYQNTFGDDLAE
jgi:outer dense fiber protein 2